MSKTDHELARAAYRAYGKTTGFKNYQGLPMPEFDKLPPNIQTAWYNSASEIRHQLETDKNGN